MVLMDRMVRMVKMDRMDRMVSQHMNLLLKVDSRVHRQSGLNL